MKDSIRTELCCVERSQIFGIHDLKWRGNALVHGRRQLALIIPDQHHAGMWRVSIGRWLSDIVNETRARDAALSLALGVLNHAQDTALDGVPIELHGPSYAGAIP